MVVGDMVIVLCCVVLCMDKVGTGSWLCLCLVGCRCEDRGIGDFALSAAFGRGVGLVGWVRCNVSMWSGCMWSEGFDQINRYVFEFGILAMLLSYFAMSPLLMHMHMMRRPVFSAPALYLLR